MSLERLIVMVFYPVEHRWLEPRQHVHQPVETVISPLEQRFGLAKTRARGPWHLALPVTRKLLTHTVSV